MGTTTYKTYWDSAFTSPYVSCGIIVTIKRNSITDKTVLITSTLRFGFHNGKSAINESRTGGIPIWVRQTIGSQTSNWYIVSEENKNWQRTTNNLVNLITLPNGTTYQVYQGSYAGTTTNYRIVDFLTKEATWTSGDLKITYQTENEGKTQSTSITIPSTYMPEYNSTCTITYNVNSIDASDIYHKANNIRGNPASFTEAPTRGSSIQLPAAAWKVYTDSFTLNIEDNTKLIFTQKGYIEIRPEQDKWKYNSNSYSPGSSFTVPNAANCTLIATNKALTPKYTNNKYTINASKFSKEPEQDGNIQQTINFTGTEENIDSKVRKKEYTYTFNGFTSNKGDKEISKDTSLYTFTSDETLTVRWEKSSESIWQPIELPYPQPRDGYTFKGWQVSGRTERFDGLIDSDVVIPNSNATNQSTLLIAQWEPNQIVDISNVVIGMPGNITLGSRTDLQSLNLNVLSNDKFTKSLNKIIPNALYFIKTFTTCDELDEIMPTGLYEYTGQANNLFESDDTFCYLLHFATKYDDNSGRIQILIPYELSNQIYIRIYRPKESPKWTPWKTINLT